MSEMDKLRSKGKRFWNFADLTVLHGFSYASKASHWVEAIFWLLAVGCCIGLAVNDLVTLVNTYMSEPTTTNIDVYYNGTSTLALPSPVICVDAMLECLNVPADFTNATEEIFTVLSAVPTSFNISALSSSALATVIRMFSLIAAMEDLSLGVNYAGSPKTDYPPSNLYEKFYTPHGVPFFYSTLQPLYTLRTKLSAAGINFTELTWQIGVFICEQFTPYALSSGSLQGVCARANITWVGSGALRTEVCMRIGASFFEFTSNLPQRTLGVLNTAKAPVSPGGAADQSAGVYNTTCVGEPISQNQPSVYFDPGGERRYNTLSPDWVTAYMASDFSTTSVAISAIYEAVSTNAHPCSTTDTIAECTLRCKQAFFMTACGCYPVSLFTLAYAKPAKMPYCVNLERAPLTQSIPAGDIVNISFAVCMAKNFASAPPTAACLLSCVHECKTTTFAVSTSTLGGVPPDAIVRAEITISRWLYPDFQETLLMDASSFLASFGGSLGLWLGASLVSLVHVPVYIFTCALRSCGEKIAMRPNGLYETSF